MHSTAQVVPNLELEDEQQHEMLESLCASSEKQVIKVAVICCVWH
jgi:hypothetical protein